MTEFKLRVDWLCYHHYGDKVHVELHVLDEEPYELHRFDTPPEAAAWARKWLEDRGFGFTCDIDTHQRLDHKHITLHPVDQKGKSDG